MTKGRDQHVNDKKRKKEKGKRSIYRRGRAKDLATGPNEAITTKTTETDENWKASRRIFAEQ